MTPSEKDALYQEFKTRFSNEMGNRGIDFHFRNADLVDALYLKFRERFINEMGSRFMRQGEVLRVFGIGLKKWGNELVLTRVLTQSAPDAENASPGVKMRACGWCGVHDIPLGVDWRYWHNGLPIHEHCINEMMTMRKD